MHDPLKLRLATGDKCCGEGCECRVHNRMRYVKQNNSCNNDVLDAKPVIIIWVSYGLEQLKKKWNCETGTVDWE